MNTTHLTSLTTKLMEILEEIILQEENVCK